MRLICPFSFFNSSIKINLYLSSNLNPFIILKNAFIAVDFPSIVLPTNIIYTTF